MSISEFVKNFIATIENLSTDQRAKLAKCTNNADLNYAHGVVTAYTQCVAFIKALENNLPKENNDAIASENK